MTIQQIADTPPWVNWTILGSSWLVSVLQPLALVITVAYGALQLYVLVDKIRKRR